MKLSSAKPRRMNAVSYPLGWFALGLLSSALLHVVACERADSRTQRDAGLTEAKQADLVRPSAVRPSAEPRRTETQDERQLGPEEVVQGSSAVSIRGLERRQPAVSPSEQPVEGSPASPAATRAQPKVKRLVLAADVEDREPIALEKPQVKEPVVAFLELANETEHATEVRVTFIHESGLKVGMIDLTVPAKSPRYRTWGRTRNISRPGTWSVVVHSADGRELERQRFDVTG